MLRFACAAAFSLLLSSPAGAQEAPAKISGIDITGYGVIEHEVESIKRQESGAVQATARRFRISSETERIPIKPGSGYGIRYIVRGSPEGAAVAITMVRKYSNPCRRTDGDVVFESRLDLNVVLGATFYSGTRFSLPGEERECLNEDAPGTTVIELWHETRKLAEKSFSTYRE